MIAADLRVGRRRQRRQQLLLERSAKKKAVRRSAADDVAGELDKPRRRASRKTIGETIAEEAIKGGTAKLLGTGTGARTVGRIASRTAAKPLARAAGSITALGGRVASAGAAAGLGVGATAAAVVGAFAVGYAIGEGLKYIWREIQPEQRAYRAALAFRQARTTFKDRYGRDPNKAEVQQLAAGFRDALRRLK